MSTLSPYDITLNNVIQDIKDGHLDLNCLGLWALYWHTGQWQETNQPRANDEFASTELGVSERTVRRAKRKLMDRGYIQTVHKTKNGFRQTYVRVTYMPNPKFNGLSKNGQN
jgi:hypothetical protein